MRTVVIKCWVCVRIEDHHYYGLRIDDHRTFGTEQEADAFLESPDGREYKVLECSFEEKP